MAKGRFLTTGAGMLSIMTLMHAGLPLASERSIAPGISSALWLQANRGFRPAAFPHPSTVGTG